MLQVEINGKQISVEKGTSLIEAANKAGTFIPHFCYHKKLSIAANCRMCLVDVEKVPKPLPACATPVADGMKVLTHSDKAKQAQKGVMEFLLLNHPLDCPICDQGGECQLQDLAVGYGQTASRFSESKHVVGPKNMGPLVSAEEMNRCIHCTRCIRFTEEIAGYQEIAMAHRGEHSEIMPFIDKVVTSELSGNVIDLCPVGALTSKPFRYNARTWELSRRKSISAHDSLGSNLIVQVKDKTVRRILPLENEAINECWLSDKDRFSYEGLNSVDRIQKPQIKQDGVWHEVDWSAALNYVVKGLKGVSHDHGKDAIGVWVNPMATVEELYLAKKLSSEFGIKNIDSRLRQQDYRLDSLKKGAQYLGQSIVEFLQSDAIFVLGASLRQDQPLLTARIRQAVNKNKTELFIVQSTVDQLNMPVSVQAFEHPETWISILLEIESYLDGQEEVSQLAKNIAEGLKKSEKSSIVLGADALSHINYAQLYLVSQRIAQKVSATLGILPTASNSVGADVLSIRPSEGGVDLNKMVEDARKAVLLVNIEPDIDLNIGSRVLETLKQAETVIAFHSFKSEVLSQYADVILPISPFTETAGSYISLEGKLQSFHATVPALGESKPLWKVLRVLANLLDLPGFEFNEIQEILDDIQLQEKLSTFLNNRIEQNLSEHIQLGKETLYRVGGVGIYASDAIVRRAPSLQKTDLAKAPEITVNYNTLTQLVLREGDSIVMTQSNGSTYQGIIKINDQLPDNVVYFPLHKENACVGGMMNQIEIKRG